MARKRSLLIVSLVVFRTISLFGADHSQALRDRLHAAAELSSLDGVSRWHWKFETTTYDQDGKNPVTGTCEMWYQDGRMRTAVTKGSDQITALSVDGKLYVTAGDMNPLLAAAFLQMEILHPIPAQVYDASVGIELARQDTSALKLDCLVPTLVKPTNAVVSLGRPFSFCLNRDTPKLLITFSSGGLGIARTHVGTFQSHEVPTLLQVVSGKTIIAEARSTRLSVETADPSLFEITAEMTPFAGPVETKQPDLRTLQLSGNPPAYPEQAKAQGWSGTVVFDAMIGKDGHIASLQATGQPNPLLEQAAKDAVTQWLYRAFEINSVTFEVKTQITVHFSLGR